MSAVVTEILQVLKDEHGVTDKQLKQFRDRVQANNYKFPYGGIKVSVDTLWIDYEVQRDVVIQQILRLLKKWDNRICQPAACNTHPDLVELIDEVKNIYKFKKLFIYDAQHRGVTLGVLGFTEIYVTVVVDEDPRFASYAFRESNSTIRKIGQPDFHRNNLRLYDLGVHDEETIPAKHLQNQFDALDIDLCEDSVRKSMDASERQAWYMSHFKYAQKPMGSDKSGATAGNILKAIITAWPKAEKIQNGAFIGLHQMNEAVKSLGVNLPADWMTQVALKVAESYKNPAHLEQAAERQVKALSGGQWTVPQGMYKFMREVYQINGGALVIPGDGMDLNLARGVWVDPTLIPNRADLYNKPLKNETMFAQEEEEYELA
jgi:hypothetical protein